MRRIRLLSAIILLCIPFAAPATAQEPVAGPVDSIVEETECNLSDPDLILVWDENGVSAPEDEAADPGDIAPEATIAPEETIAPEATADPAPEDIAAAPWPAHEGPEYFQAPLETYGIKLKKKNTSRTVFMRVPYRISVKGSKVDSVASDNRKIAQVDEDGMLVMRNPGNATITVKAVSGAVYKLALKVVSAPAPKDLTISVSRTKMKLHWSAAWHATGYLVEYSLDGVNWQDYKAARVDQLAMNVTDLVTGATWFRVRAILGDHFGGVTAPISVLTPVSDLKVFMEESYNFGPTDRMNITWSASPGASKYEVYRTSLPSENYRLIGTTKETWFADTLAPTRLYAYKVRPVWNSTLKVPLSDPVTLWTGMQNNVLPPSDMTSSTGKILVVNKTAQVVTCYIRDADGRYTLPLRHMICSSGLNYDRTRNGVYTLESKKGEWYTYPGPSGDTIRWPSVYRSGYYFHSPLYNRDHSIRTYTVSRLGSRASAGCVRLKSNDAQWVYENCEIGTTVFICDGAARDDLRNALRPKTVSVSGF